MTDKTQKDEQSQVSPQRGLFDAMMELVEPQIQVLQERLDAAKTALAEEGGDTATRTYFDDALIKYATAIAAINTRAVQTAAQTSALAMSVPRGRPQSMAQEEAAAADWLDSLRAKVRSPIGPSVTKKE